MALAVSKNVIRPASSLLDQIGNTPLIGWQGRRGPSGRRDLRQAEFFNPGGSVKDRAALNMILEGERTGQADHGSRAARRHQRQHRHRLCHDLRDQGLPGQAVPAGQRLARAQADLKAYGAEMVFSRSRRRLRRRHPPVPGDLRSRSRSIFIPDQYSNPANWRAHFDGTGARDHRADQRPRHPFVPAWAPAELSWARRGV